MDSEFDIIYHKCCVSKWVCSYNEWFLERALKLKMAMYRPKGEMFFVNSGTNLKVQNFKVHLLKRIAICLVENSKCKLEIFYFLLQ